MMPSFVKVKFEIDAQNMQAGRAGIFLVSAAVLSTLQARTPTSQKQAHAKVSISLLASLQFYWVSQLGYPDHV
jgi:hypothetical protein